MNADATASCLKRAVSYHPCRVVGSNLRCIDHRSRAMPKHTPIPLRDKIAAALLQALAGIGAVRNDRLVLQRPDIDRRPGLDRTKDYNVLWRGRCIGRIWCHEYKLHPWEGLGPWHWDWQWDRLGVTKGHAPTLEAAMADFRKAWDSDKAKSQRA